MKGNLNISPVQPVLRSPIPVRPPAAPTSPDYEFIAYLFNMRLLEEIAALPDAYCLDRLLKPQSGRSAGQIVAQFETESWCKTEDRKRANGLRAAARQIPLNRADLVSQYHLPRSFVTKMNEGTRELALDLAARLDISATGGRLTTALPSAIFKRILRQRLLGAILSLIDDQPNTPLELVTIAHRSWDFPISHFVVPLDGHPTVQLRKDLTVTGVSDSAGFLIAYPEVEFDPADDGFQLYFRGIVTGAKIEALQNLRKAHGYDGASVSYRPFIAGPRPYSRVQIAAALNRFWPQQTWGTFGYRLKTEARTEMCKLKSNG